MKNKFIISILLILTALALVSFAVQESVLLRLHPRSDINYIITYKESDRRQFQSFDKSSYFESKVSFAVKGYGPKSSTEIQAQEESIKVISSDVNLGEGAGCYNSEHTEFNDPNFIQLYDPYIKKPVFVSYDEMGCNMAPDSILNKENMFLGNVFSMVFVPLPKERISVGSRWSFERGGIDWTYTVTAITKKDIEVDFVGSWDNDYTTGRSEGKATIHPTMGFVTKSSSNAMAVYNASKGPENTTVILRDYYLSVKEK